MTDKLGDHEHMSEQHQAYLAGQQLQPRISIE